MLERIIDIASNEGDIILDPFCGSGTTLVAGKLNNRKVIGIDKSKEAINLTKSRLDKPIKSESNLLKKGKKAYQNVSAMVEKLLHNIDYIPVQRNSGIDAILKTTYQDSPILIRIQKENETIEDAIKSLNKAVITKSSKKSFLIRTNDIKSLLEHDKENSNIEIVNSTIYELNKLLSKANC